MMSYPRELRYLNIYRALKMKHVTEIMSAQSSFIIYKRFLLRLKLSWLEMRERYVKTHSPALSQPGRAINPHANFVKYETR